MNSKSCKVIMDLQFGSTGKGLIAGYLAKRDRPDTVVTAWAANAGHTFIDANGRKFVHTMVANGVVSPLLRRLLIGPGSVIDPAALERELVGVHDLLHNVAVMIHPSAAIITDELRAQEADFHRIGSTKKGVGAAMCERIWRHNPGNVAANTALLGCLGPLVCSRDQYRIALDEARVIQIEGAQGHSLSLYHGFYPYTTSRDVSVAQVAADCGLPYHWVTRVVGALRTYPIRVANRYDDHGVQIGTSGPWYRDQQEMQWADLGREPELTTVTKLPRRIATFSWLQLREAVWQNGVHDLFLNFANYLPQSTPTVTSATALMVRAIDRYLADLRTSQGNRPGGVVPRVQFIGHGPTENDVECRDGCFVPINEGDAHAANVGSRHTPAATSSGR